MSSATVKNTEITIADWLHDNATLRAIRQSVFIDEQNVPEALEWDEYDNSATHFLVRVEGQAIATARLKHDGQIGRMAVLAKYRHKNIGSQLLDFILQTAQQKKIKQVFLHAQVQVIDFYKKHGFTERGKTFLDANIWHCEMVYKGSFH